MAAVESMLTALAGGSRITIGQDPLDRLRSLSDSRRLACPLCRAPVVLRPGDLERGMLWDRSPLLFLDSVGERLPAGAIGRFRPAPNAGPRCLRGTLSVRSLADLPFPWWLLEWPRKEIADFGLRIAD